MAVPIESPPHTILTEQPKYIEPAPQLPTIVVEDLSSQSKTMLSNFEQREGFDLELSSENTIAASKDETRTLSNSGLSIQQSEHRHFTYSPSSSLHVKSAQELEKYRRVSSCLPKSLQRVPTRSTSLHKTSINFDSGEHSNLMATDRAIPKTGDPRDEIYSMYGSEWL